MVRDSVELGSTPGCGKVILPRLNGVSQQQNGLTRRPLQFFLLRRAWRARYSLPRMFRFRFSPLAALAGLLIVFTSCERHHVGELPELQKEHLHPLEAAAEEPVRAAVPSPPLASPTPANFFPNQQP